MPSEDDAPRASDAVTSPTSMLFTPNMDGIENWLLKSPDPSSCTPASNISWLLSPEMRATTLPQPDPELLPTGSPALAKEPTRTGCGPAVGENFEMGHGSDDPGERAAPTNQDDIISTMDIDPPQTSRVHPNRDSGQSNIGNLELGLASRLDQVHTDMIRFHETFREYQRATDARLISLAEDVRAMRSGPARNRRATSPDSNNNNTPASRRKTQKDSTANYLRRCIRKHVASSFGLTASGVLPRAPTPETMQLLLTQINQGLYFRKPFQFDWTATFSSTYNMCIEDAFCADFWQSVEGGQYDLQLIPMRYRARDPFVRIYRRHLVHLKKLWASQQDPPPASTKAAKAKHYARNSRIGTTFRNRRDAASYIPVPDSAHVFNLVETVGTAGISSDEEVAVPPGQGRQYATYDKPWRANALVCLYRHLDLMHAATRNPNGNPIRVRHRTMRVHEPFSVPKGLPLDCYNAFFLNRCTPLERQLLQATPPIGVDELWMRVQGYTVV